MYARPSILLPLFDGSPTAASVTVWAEKLKPLYECNPFSHTVPNGSVRDRVHWLFRAVHQVRVYARAMDRTRGSHYAVALANALLFKASKGKNVSPSKALRLGAAYYFAELVLRNTFP